jgi:hypothetical protein
MGYETAWWFLGSLAPPLTFADANSEVVSESRLAELVVPSSIWFVFIVSFLAVGPW